MQPELATNQTTIRELARLLTRWFWIPLLLALIGAFAPRLLAEEELEGQAAIARIGLTSNVEWPFFGAARERVLGHADDAPIGDVAPQLADEISDVDVSAPPNEAFVLVEVRATSLATATEAANVYADHLIESDATIRQAELVRLADSYRSTYDGLQASLEEYDVQLAELIAAEARAEADWLAASSAGQNIEASRRTQVQASQAINDARAGRDQIIRAQNEIVRDLIRAEADVSSAPRDVELLRSAQPVDAPVSRSDLSMVLGAMSGLVVGLLIVWTLASEWGDIRSAESVHLSLGTRTTDLAPEGIASVKLWASRHGGSRALAIAGVGSASSLVYDELQRTLPATEVLSRHDELGAPRGGGVIGAIAARELHPATEDLITIHSTIADLVDQASRAGRSTLIDVGEPGTAWFAMTAPLCDRSVAVVPGSTSKRALKRFLHRLALEDLRAEWLVVPGPKSAHSS